MQIAPIDIHNLLEERRANKNIPCYIHILHIATGQANCSVNRIDSNANMVLSLHFFPFWPFNSRQCATER